MNNRNAAWQYDAEGHLTSDTRVHYTIDAAGRAPHVLMPELDQRQSFDGDGRRVRTLEARTFYDDLGGPTGQTSTETKYEIRSSVLAGKLVTEIDAAGQKRRTLLYLNGVVVGWQQRYDNGRQSVAWEHRDAHEGSFRMTGEGGTLLSDYAAELDPSHANAGLSAPRSPNNRSRGRIM